MANSNFSVGGISANVNAQQVNFTDGTVQTTAGAPVGSGVTSLNAETGAVHIIAGSNITVTPSGQNIMIAVTPVMQTGIAVCTGGSPTVTFASLFVGPTAPNVVVSQIGTTPNGLGVACHILGSSGAWTGFTLELSGSFFGAYVYIAFGTPN